MRESLSAAARDQRRAALSDDLRDLQAKYKLNFNQKLANEEINRIKIANSAKSTGGISSKNACLE